MAIRDVASNNIIGKTSLLEPGAKMQVSAWTGPSLESADWKSAKSKVTSVNLNGNITTNATGSAKITATVCKCTATFTVKAAIKIYRITIGVKNNAPAVVISGKTLNLTAATNADASSKKVTWALNHPEDGNYASINASGVVKAAANLTEHRQIEVVAMAEDGGFRSAPFPVDIYPASCQCSHPVERKSSQQAYCCHFLEGQCAWR